MQLQLGNLKRLRTTTKESERDHIVALARVWVETSDWFGAPSAVHAGPVCTLVAVSPAGATVAAESHRVGEDRIGLNGTAGQYGCAVFHLVIGTASLDKEAWPKYIPHVAVLLTIHKHMNEPNTFQFEKTKLYLVSVFK